MCGFRCRDVAFMSVKAKVQSAFTTNEIDMVDQDALSLVVFELDLLV